MRKWNYSTSIARLVMLCNVAHGLKVVADILLNKNKEKNPYL